MDLAFPSYKMLTEIRLVGITPNYLSPLNNSNEALSTPPEQPAQNETRPLRPYRDLCHSLAHEVSRIIPEFHGIIGIQSSRSTLTRAMVSVARKDGQPIFSDA